MNHDTPKSSLLAELRQLFQQSGSNMYAGEPVTQTEHALQAASLAEQDGASDALVVAGLLHDVGHLLHDLGEDIAEHGVDDCHEQLGAEWLQQHFPDAVTQPVMLHVAAKRYRCAIDEQYYQKLSSASRLSLSLQGGPFSASQVQHFREGPFFHDALQLRGWDEAAKVPGMATPGLEHYLIRVGSLLDSNGPLLSPGHS